MKKLILQRVVFIFVSLFLLMSCMEEGPNTHDGFAFGIVRFDMKSGENVLDINDEVNLYASRFSFDNDGDCFFVTYLINYDDEANSFEKIEANGFVKVSIFDKLDVNRYYLATTIDTTNVLPGEVPLEAAFWDMNGYIRYFQNKLFMFSVLQIPTDQKMDFHMSYDIENMVTEQYGKRYYNLFLRSTILDKEGTSSKDMVVIPNAFEIRNFLMEAARKEKESGTNLTFSIRLNYPTVIRDNGVMTWAHQDLVDAFKISDILE